MSEDIYTQHDRDLKCLDGLIANFTRTDEVGQGPCASLLEHLRAARRNLLGSMHGEYDLSLRLAKESVASIPDKAAQAEVRKILKILAG